MNYCSCKIGSRFGNLLWLSKTNVSFSMKFIINWTSVLMNCSDIPPRGEGVVIYGCINVLLGS